MENRKKILWVLMAFFVFYKVITLRMFDTGGDAINYWFAAKQLYYSLPYGELTHQTTRFGIVLPVYLSQLLFGIHPLVTAFLPNFLLLLQVIFIYKIGVKAHGVNAGFFSAILFMLFPSVIRWSGQILPPAFEGPAVTMGFYFLLKYGETEKGQMRYLFSSALMLFWAYAAKETSIYLMPAFLAGIFLLKKNLRHMIIFSAFLFALFLIECGLFWLFTGDFLARVHSVSGNHLELEKLVPVTFFDLFRRYTDSPVFLRITFFSYLLFLIPVWIKSNAKVKGLVLCGLIYNLLILFSVKSVNPIIPAMSFKDQYLMAGLPFVIIVIVLGVIKIYGRITSWLRAVEPGFSQENSIKPCVLTTLILSVLLLLVTGLRPLSQKTLVYYRGMYNSLFRLNEHHLAGFFRNHAMINEAYKRNIPVVSDYIYKTADYQLYNRVREFMTSGITLDKACHKAGITIKRYNQIRPGVSGKSLEAVRKVFLDLKPDSLPQIRTATTGNDIFYYIVKDIPDDPSSVLRTGTRVLFIKNDSREFRAFYGFIGQKLDKDHQAMEKPESDG